MLLAALLCGLFTAYYFGVRPGAAAAVATLGVFLAAELFPPLKVLAYMAVGAGIVGVTVVGAKRPRDPTFGRVVDIGKRLVGQVWKK